MAPRSFRRRKPSRIVRPSPTPPSAALNNPAWASNFGFAYDRQGRDSTDAACYSAMVDTDGTLFTLATNTTETTPFYPAFDTMKFGADTKIILSAGAEFTVNDLEGFPTFEHGDVKVTGTWTVDAKAMTEAAQAVFGGKVTFAPGAKLVIAHANDRAAFRPNGAFLSIASEDGIDGLPVVEAAGKAKWLFVKSADGKSCTLERRPTGLLLILK